MKRGDLQRIKGLSKEQIESIMKLHQVDAERHKKDMKARDTKIQTMESKITELSEIVKQYDDLDILKLQQGIDWVKGYEEDLISAMKDEIVRFAIAKAHSRNEKIFMALLGLDMVMVNADDTAISLNEQLEAIQKESGSLLELDN